MFQNLGFLKIEVLIQSRPGIRGDRFPHFLKSEQLNHLHFLIYSLGVILHLWTLYRQAVEGDLSFWKKSLVTEPTDRKVGIHLE